MQLDGVLNKIESHTTVEVSGSNLFKITHIDADPRRAKDVVQAFLNIFVENNLGKDRDDMANVRSFLEKQIAGYEEQLQATEKRMADFRSKYADVTSSSGSSYAARLEKARADVEEASADLAAAKERKDRLPKQLEKTPKSSENNSPEYYQPRDATVAKLAELRAELDKKLGDVYRSTPRHHRT